MCVWCDGVCDGVVDVNWIKKCMIGGGLKLWCYVCVCV